MEKADALGRTLAGFAVSLRYEHIPADIVEKAKVHMLDALGVMIAGSEYQPSKILYEMYSTLGGAPESTVFGYSRRLPSLNAALINGTSGHGIEMDDGRPKAHVHPGAVIFPSVLAMAESLRAPGKAVLTALVTGYEVMLRLGMATFPNIRRAGFHPTPILGTIGSALAAGQLLSLNEEEMLNALGLAGTQAFGLRQGRNAGAHMAKRFHAGKAAQNGLLAASLAKKGFSGSHSILEGEQGILSLYAKTYDSEFIRRIGDEFLFGQCYLRPYAAVRHVHAPIDTLFKLKQVHQFDPSKIDQMVLKIYREGSIYTKKHPESFFDAQFSIPYVLAIACLESSVSLEQFTPEKIQDASVQRLAEKVEVVLDEEMDGLYKQTGKRAHSLEITLANGEKISGTTEYPKGGLENPMSQEEVLLKFKKLSSSWLPPTSQEKIKEMIHNLEQLPTFDSFWREIGGRR